MSGDLYTLRALARVTLALGRVERATRHPDGVPETVTTHTVMLALAALRLAAAHPEWGLDRGRLLSLALVHDLAEVVTGDQDTSLGLDPGAAADKEAREWDALNLLGEGGLWPLVLMARDYVRQESPEARCLRYLDKILPKLVQTLSGGRQHVEAGVSVARMRAAHEAQIARLRTELPEWAERLEPLLKGACADAEAALAAALGGDQ